jgi:tRNA (guanine-N7-)-methyltransferase
MIEPGSLVDALPLDAIFPTPRPLEVDIGCGKGRFLLARAEAHPNTNFLGIDRMVSRLRKIDRKLRRRGLENVRLLRLEAAYSVEYLLPPQSVTTFYIFFPDPWPKRRHHRRRLMGDAFLDVAASRLVPGGTLHFATDHLDYYDAGDRLLRDHAAFEEIETFVPSGDEQTDFERLFLGKGKPIGRCSFSRVG